MTERELERPAQRRLPVLRLAGIKHGWPEKAWRPRVGDAILSAVSRVDAAPELLLAS